jgi:hypothetical protein
MSRNYTFLKMKLFLTIALALLTIVTNGQQPQSTFKISTFKDVPKDMEGCGENFFFNKQDEKAERFILFTDYARALICIDNKMILINDAGRKAQNANRVFSNKDYTVIIQYGPMKNTGDESYEIKSAVITLKYHSKVVWTKNVIGGGGC